MKKILVLALTMALVMVGGVMGAVDTGVSTATVTVNTFLSVTLSNDPVTFPNMDPLETANATVGTGFPLTATIGAESNVNAKVETKANSANFGGAGTIAVSNMEWSATTVFGTGYTTTNAEVCASVAAAGTCNIYHQLTIPLAQAAGAYNVGITITATSI